MIKTSISVLLLLILAAWTDYGTASESPSISILIEDFNLSKPHKTAKGLPLGWSLSVWRGSPRVEIVKQSNKKVLRMQTDEASASLYRKVDIDLRKYPVLSWRWKVTRLPESADARIKNRDDQAAGVYVLFPGFPTFINSKAIGYIWDSNAPKGRFLQSKKSSLVHYVVVRNGPEELGNWITEERNVLEDYRRIFGQAPPKVGGVSFMSDSDDTRSQSESDFMWIVFMNQANTTTKMRPRLTAP